VTALTALTGHLDGGFSSYHREEWEKGIEPLAAAVRDKCGDRGARIADALVGRATGRLTPSDAVKALSKDAVLGDESDELAMRALSSCAKFSLKGAPPDQHRDFRRRALAIASRLNDVKATLAIQNNWLFAELTEGNVDEAERLYTAVSQLVDASPVSTRNDPTMIEIRARFLAHSAKLAFRHARDAASTVAAKAFVTRAQSAYDAAIKLVSKQDHTRVNLQIEYVSELAEAALYRTEITVEALRRALERPRRALEAHACDDCRAYFATAEAAVHETAAEKIINQDEAEAIKELQAAVAARDEAANAYAKVRHHLVEEQQELASEVRATLERIRRPRRIFLSHAGIDKPRVRQFASVLTQIGFSPWLDERELAGGAPLERGLAEGFAESCAAVFFLTPGFHDTGYLRTEIDYALPRRRRDEKRFVIVPLALDWGDREPKVPAVLEPLVFKKAGSDLEALRELLAALPVRPGTVFWKDGAG
jgi:hypothetical protein